MRVLHMIGLATAATLAIAATPTQAAPAAPAAPHAGRCTGSYTGGTVGHLADPGKAIFEGRGACFTCHGRNGKGTPLGPDLTDATWLNFDAPPDQAAMEALVREGVAKPVRHPAPMPPMGGARLTDDEVRQVAAYVLVLAGNDGVNR
jgi:mono/diheme cytochrome c family protein